ncbi:hypothetical protein B9Z65_6305 [Elsinoe australis]|uniref:Uncharacterized protein n=1 Tax=Elsinoe australis TaxID=40998 RepID=A0A2P8A896_9PEZI|nr:hypothetical protein B9Z65_6305 [Elsinoe australis]
MTAVTSNSEIDASFGLCIPELLTKWMKISPKIHIHNFSVRAPNTNKETDTHSVLPARLVFKQAKTIGDSKAGVSISASCGEWGYQVVVGRLPPEWTAHVYRSVTKDASTGERSVKVMPSGGEIIATCQNWSGDRGELRDRVRAFTERLAAGWHLLDKGLPIRQLAEIRTPTELLE